MNEEQRLRLATLAERQEALIECQTYERRLENLEEVSEDELLSWLPKIQRAREFIQEQRPMDQIEWVLLNTLEGLSRLGITDDLERAAAKPGNTLPITGFKELWFLRDLAEMALTLLDQPEEHVQLMLLLIEVGRRLPVLATITGHDFSLECLLGAHENLQDFFHKHRCAAALDERYFEDREDYRLALEEARQYWDEGGSDLHHVLAKRLAGRHNVPLGPLKKRLAPIARAYGRCFGDKGAKKPVRPYSPD